MKILQLGKFYPIRGGVEKVMWNLTRGISGRGIDCDMLCARLKGDAADPADLPFEQPDSSFRLNEHGRVWCVRSYAKKAATMLSPEMISWLRAHKDEYDIIHIHHPDPMAALALWLSGFRGKVILHWHSDILSQKFLLALFRPLQRWLVRRADHIIGTTPVYLEASPELKDVQDKCTAIPIGIRPLSYNTAAAADIRSRFPGGTLLLSVGRLVPYKGFSVLIEAMKYLPESFRLIIGGIGPLREELEALIERNSLGERVCLEGYLPDESLPDYYGACDIFVLSSIMKTEAFGIVQLEAMSVGKPVVATKIPDSGVSWVNADGLSGLNVPPGDARALADAIQQVRLNYDRFSAGALERFDKYFTEDQMINSIIKQYEAIL